MPDMDDHAGIAQAHALLEFWFGPLEREQARDVWFTADAGFDAALRERFLVDHEHAAGGRYDSWRRAPDTTLALILLLDQLPRNLFRGSPRAFASDAQARDVARHAAALGFDRALPPVWRWFVYLPFQHSEDLADQELSLRLHDTLPGSAETAEVQDYARRHHEIIARFGRFPHRNRILGRTSTPEEQTFLAQPGSRF